MSPLELKIGDPRSEIYHQVYSVVSCRTRLMSCSLDMRKQIGDALLGHILNEWSFHDIHPGSSMVVNLLDNSGTDNP